MKSRRVIIIFLKLVLAYNVCLGQNNEIKLANEYFIAGNYEKAYSVFDDLSKKNSNIPFIYTNYLATLNALKKNQEAEKFIRKAIKFNPQNIYYKLDLYFNLKENNADKASKHLSQVIDEVKHNQMDVENAAEYLLKFNETAKTRELLLAARKVSPSKNEYAVSLAKVYLLEGNKEMMISEMLNYLNANPYQLESVKNNFQNYLKEKEDFSLLENRLYELVQKEPENLVYNELLLWLNIQNKNFRSAYLQAKAIDKRNKLQGTKLIEVGRIALENKDYDAAIKFFQTVVEDNKAGYNYSFARRLLILSKEESVKNTYPIDKLKIQSLVKDYQKLVFELGKVPQAYEAMKSIAVLYGFYLDQKDSAILLLNQVISEARFDERLRSQAKIHLADIYLLNEEPWEASLLYSQVEKDMKEDQLSHEAKLKNAKLAYYKGEFELAQAHLDILKMATTREIANDAMDLSILIQDNTALDTTTEALKEYAAIDLLLFQNKDSLALERLDSMLKTFPDHSLTDEIYWLKSKIYRKSGQYMECVNMLNKIIGLYKAGIFGDDAFFTKGVILEENLSDKEAAMNLYKEFLFEYPGSIYTAEARKRFRLLRGDKL